MSNPTTTKWKRGRPKWFKPKPKLEEPKKVLRLEDQPIIPVFDNFQEENNKLLKQISDSLVAHSDMLWSIWAGIMHMLKKEQEQKELEAQKKKEEEEKIQKQIEEDAKAEKEKDMELTLYEWFIDLYNSDMKLSIGQAQSRETIEEMYKRRYPNKVYESPNWTKYSIKNLYIMAI